MTKPVPSSWRLHDGAFPRIFSTLFCTSCTTARFASAGIRRPDLRDRGGRERAQHVREAGAVEHLAQVGGQLAGRGGHHLVDGAQHRGVAHARSEPGHARRGQRQRDQPGRDDHRRRLQHRAERGVDGEGALAADPVADVPAEVHPGGLAQRDEHHDHHDADHDLRVLGLEVRGEQRRELHAQDRAADDADERQQRDGHAVAPPGDPGDERQQHDEHVDPAHGVFSPPLVACLAEPGRGDRELARSLTTPRPPDPRLAPRPMPRPDPAPSLRPRVVPSLPGAATPTAGPP